MNKDKKQYIHFNPTQINNYGSGENSVQTIHRKAKEQIDNPMGFIDSVITLVNSVFAIIAKSLKYSIFTVVLPFIACGLLGWFLFYWFVLNPNPSLSHFVSGSFGVLGQIFAQIPAVLIIVKPFLIIGGCSILFLMVSSFVIAYLLYPKDIKGRRKCFIALFGVQLGLFLYNAFTD